VGVLDLLELLTRLELAVASVAETGQDVAILSTRHIERSENMRNILKPHPS
jgi:hypothetical protein